MSVGLRVSAGVVEQDSAGYGTESGDFDFESAEVRVQILANAISDVDERSLFKGKFPRSCGHVPPDGAHGGGALFLREFQAEVALFHGAWR